MPANIEKSMHARGLHRGVTIMLSPFQSGNLAQNEITGRGISDSRAGIDPHLRIEAIHFFREDLWVGVIRAAEESLAWMSLRVCMDSPMFYTLSSILCHNEKSEIEFRSR